MWQRRKKADLHSHTNLDNRELCCNLKIIYDKFLDISPKRGPV
jgi:hypothetical protein